MYRYVILLITSVVIASISQILLKKSANKKYEIKIKEYLNLFVFMAYGLLIISTVLTMLAYKGLQLSQGMILESISYILIPIFSYYLFNEKFTKRKILGIIVIILGISIFSILN